MLVLILIDWEPVCLSTGEVDVAGVLVVVFITGKMLVLYRLIDFTCFLRQCLSFTISSFHFCTAKVAILAVELLLIYKPENRAYFIFVSLCNVFLHYAKSLFISVCLKSTFVYIQGNHHLETP